MNLGVLTKWDGAGQKEDFVFRVCCGSSSSFGPSTFRVLEARADTDGCSVLRTGCWAFQSIAGEETRFRRYCSGERASSFPSCFTAALTGEGVPIPPCIVPAPFIAVSAGDIFST